MPKYLLPKSCTATVKRIAQHLYLNGDFIEDTSLSSGRSGIVLFAYYYADIMKDSDYGKFADDLLETVIKNVSESMDAFYETGISGIGRLLIHLSSNNFVELEGDDVFENFDESLSQYLRCECGQRHRFMQMTGPAVYFHERNYNYFDNSAPQKEELPQLRQLIINKLLLKWTVERKSLCELLSHDKLNERILAERDVKDAVYEPSVLPTLLQMFRRHPNEKSLGFLIYNVFNLQQRILSGLKKKEPSATQKSMSYAYWSYVIQLVYAQLIYIINTGKEYGCEQEHIEHIRHALLQLTLAKKEAISKENDIYTGNLKLVLICNALYRFTNDHFFQRQQEKILARYLDPQKYSIAGIPTGSYKVNNFSVNKGLSGIGLVLLSCIADRYLPWEEMIFHYDLVRAKHLTTTLNIS